MSDYTDIIVGAGSAGAVIAARLSDDPNRRILLIEAGPDLATDHLPPDVQNGLYPSFADHDWGYLAQAAPGRDIPMARGKLVGGCSAINTSLAIRPDPLDFEEWTGLGLTGWRWEDVLPYYRKLESDQDFQSEIHGTHGPIPVHRWRDDELIPLQQAMLDVCQELGYSRIEDLNGEPGEGVAALPQNLRNGQRISTAIGYLDPVRDRNNLVILPDTLVDAVEVENGTATAVRVITDGQSRTITGDRIVISAGAIGTPAILLRSGIGGKDALAELGVPVVADLPGVGAHLMDHPACLITVQPQPGVCDMKDPVCQILLRYTATGSTERDDMQIYLYSQIDLSGYASDLLDGADDPLVFMISIGVERPRSFGRVTLPSLDPAAAPTIELNYLTDPEDLRRMREGVRLGWEIAQHPAIQKYTNRILSPTAEIMQSQAQLDEFMLGSSTTHYHPVGTAKMGTADDPSAVVDDRCRVFGIENLRVADGSVMPTMIRANTNLTCIAIGEKVADWLLTGD